MPTSSRSALVERACTTCGGRCCALAATVATVSPPRMLIAASLFMSAPFHSNAIRALGLATPGHLREEGEGVGVFLVVRLRRRETLPVALDRLVDEDLVG